MSVRQAQPRDFPAVYLMGYDRWNEGLNQAAYLDACSTSTRYRAGTWWVLTDANDRPRASLIVYDLYSGKFGLASIATEPSLRGQGLAKRLIQSVCRSLTDPRAVFLFSEVGTALYERCGFAPFPDIHQHVPGQICMIWTPDSRAVEFVSQPGFQPPALF